MCDSISMESTNLHHQLHEDELVGSSNPVASLPSSCFSNVPNNEHPWRTSSFFL